jgi:hypothetical protein
MKPASVISAVILFFLLGTIAPAYAQHEQEGKEQGKPQQGQQHQQAQPAQHQQPAQQHQTNRPAPSQAKPQPSYGGAYHGGVQANSKTTYGGVHPSGVPQHKGQVHSGFAQSRATSWNSEHRTWTQRGGYNGYRVPQDRFNRYFGRGHHFHIYGLPLVFVGGYPRFQYDGYWVTFVDPWPDTWPDTWYETDNVYLDYTDDGYYLYDLSRPGPAIAVTITF